MDSPTFWSIVLSLLAVFVPLLLAWYLVARWCEPRQPRRRPGRPRR